MWTKRLLSPQQNQEEERGYSVNRLDCGEINPPPLPPEILRFHFFWSDYVLYISSSQLIIFLIAFSIADK